MHGAFQLDSALRLFRRDASFRTAHTLQRTHYMELVYLFFCSVRVVHTKLLRPPIYTQPNQRSSYFYVFKASFAASRYAPTLTLPLSATRHGTKAVTSVLAVYLHPTTTTDGTLWEKRTDTNYLTFPTISPLWRHYDVTK